MTDEPLRTLFLQNYGPTSEKLANIFQKKIEAEIATIQVFEDVSETVNRLQAAGYQIVVTSNLAKDFWEPVRALLPFKPDFAFLSYKIGARKPHPKIFETIIKATGFEPNQILHVGDKSVNDCAGAKSVGMKTLLLDRSQVRWFQTSGTIQNLQQLEYLLLL